MGRVLVSVLSLAAIIGSVRYAYGREFVRHSNLEAEYSQINKQYFDGQLPTVTVEWEVLTDECYGITEHDKNGVYFEIKLDPHENPDMDRLRETLKHESCHVYVFPRIQTQKTTALSSKTA
jgi:SprT-like family protein